MIKNHGVEIFQPGDALDAVRFKLNTNFGRVITNLQAAGDFVRIEKIGPGRYHIWRKCRPCESNNGGNGSGDGGTDPPTDPVPDPPNDPPTDPPLDPTGIIYKVTECTTGEVDYTNLPGFGEVIGKVVTLGARGGCWQVARGNGPLGAINYGYGSVFDTCAECTGDDAPCYIRDNGGIPQVSYDNTNWTDLSTSYTVNYSLTQDNCPTGSPSTSNGPATVTWSPSSLTWIGTDGDSNAVEIIPDFTPPSDCQWVVSFNGLVDATKASGSSPVGSYAGGTTTCADTGGAGYASVSGVSVS